MKKVIINTLVFILLTMVMTLLLGGIQETTGLSNSLISLPQLAPALGFTLTALLFKRIKLRLQLKFDAWSIYKMALAFILPFLILFKVYLVVNLLDMNVAVPDGHLYALWPVLPGIILGAAGEEIGWRGFLQRHFEARFSVLLSGVFTGLCWGLWHVHLYQNGMLYLLAFLLFTISSSVVLTWLMRGTSYNVIVATLFHVSLNLGFYYFFETFLQQTSVMLSIGIVWAIPGFIVALNSKHHAYISDMSQIQV